MMSKSAVEKSFIVPQVVIELRRLQFRNFSFSMILQCRVDVEFQIRITVGLAKIQRRKGNSVRQKSDTCPNCRNEDEKHSSQCSSFVFQMRSGDCKLLVKFRSSCRFPSNIRADHQRKKHRKHVEHKQHNCIIDWLHQNAALIQQHILINNRSTIKRQRHIPKWTCVASFTLASPDKLHFGRQLLHLQANLAQPTSPQSKYFKSFVKATFALADEALYLFISE
ncbi:hypothetical protein T03_9747 [Trichinella britovi]|uniref:Uncharacterized protein n=2 Tax=Trichinella TaxID=6333 RepID=A0A0V1CKX5_TRIBR|nr:hypothetical protein T05_14206 [Trichinella murrelli]KRX66544.1 hypothetical protein T09_3435 [Trichinella sp. T9]KRY49694.1 hypothetical protein T03_9747 [Trichinella britovi]